MFTHLLLRNFEKNIAKKVVQVVPNLYILNSQ